MIGVEIAGRHDVQDEQTRSVIVSQSDRVAQSGPR
jgi:hypothetical protein